MRVVFAGGNGIDLTRVRIEAKDITGHPEELCEIGALVAGETYVVSLASQDEARVEGEAKMVLLKKHAREAEKKKTFEQCTATLKSMDDLDSDRQTVERLIEEAGKAGCRCVGLPGGCIVSYSSLLSW